MNGAWWRVPLRKGYASALPDTRLTEVIARMHAVVEVGGFTELGPARGRSFERVFYSLCERCQLQLSEKAGSRTLAGQPSASGLAHEVDGATRAAGYLTHWELKNLSAPLEKNELLIFNSKSLDFLQGHERRAAGLPLHRFLLSGGTVPDGCRRFASLWGIMVIEPLRLPFPLLREAAARGGVDALNSAEMQAVQDFAAWACRSTQAVLQELARWSAGATTPLPLLANSMRLRAIEALDVQEQIGRTLLDWLDEVYPDWVDETAEDTWRLVGGW